MDISMIIGLIVIIFGISLIFLKSFWRIFTKGLGQFNADYENSGLKMVKLDKYVKYTGVDSKYNVSNKGFNILGIIFILLGLIIILLPFIYSLL